MQQHSGQIQVGTSTSGGDGDLAGKLPAGPRQDSATRQPLGLFDAVCIIVGIVVGAGIYQTAPLIFKNVNSPITAMAAWAVAGVLSLVGALCYAELATTYPRTGGDYVYLGRAFGPWLGFLFGWVQLTVILTGSIGMMAFVFADYATRLADSAFGLKLGTLSAFAFAGGAVFVLTVTNVLGVVFGKVMQNILSVAKVLGLGAIIVAGFSTPLTDAWAQPALSQAALEKVAWPGFTPLLGTGMVLILYTYGGWNDTAFVAAEVRNGQRNITRALVLGILIITALYLLVNAAYIQALGFAGAQGSRQIAADVLNLPLGRGGASMMCVVVMISALGAVNGLIFTGARVYSTIGRDHAVLSWMGRWDRGRGTPVAALVTQGCICLGLILLVATPRGQDWLNSLLEFVNLKKLNWEGAGGFDTLLTCTAPIFWLFFLLTGLSLFVLRQRDPDIERPFKVPLYPELPVIFCGMCAYMLYSSTEYAVSREWKGGVLLLGVVPLLLGLPLYRLSCLLNSPGNDRAAGPAEGPDAERF